MAVHHHAFRSISIESMPYVLCAHPSMLAFPDVANLALTMTLSGGLRERSIEFYEALTANFAIVMGALIQVGIIVPTTGGLQLRYFLSLKDDPK